MEHLRKSSKKIELGVLGYPFMTIPGGLLTKMGESDAEKYMGCSSWSDGKISGVHF